MQKENIVILVDDSEVLRVFFKMFFQKYFKKYKLITFSNFEELEKNLDLLDKTKLLIFDYNINNAEKYPTAIDFLENYRIDKNIVLFTGSESSVLDKRMLTSDFKEIIYKSESLVKSIRKKLSKYLNG